MRITLHAVAAGIIAALACAAALPVALDTGTARPISVEKLTVDLNVVRKPVATADRAIGPVVPEHQGIPVMNPFLAPEKGRRVQTPIPEPPPPPFDLPEPPPTPFTPGG